MQTIYTASGKRYDADMCGVSWLGQLYIAIAGKGFAELLAVFGDPAETAALVCEDDGRQTRYTGYTELLGLQKDGRGGLIRLCLGRPQKEEV